MWVKLSPLCPATPTRNSSQAAQPSYSNIVRTRTKGNWNFSTEKVEYTMPEQKVFHCSGVTQRMRQVNQCVRAVNCLANTRTLSTPLIVHRAEKKVHFRWFDDESAQTQALIDRGPNGSPSPDLSLWTGQAGGGVDGRDRVRSRLRWMVLSRESSRLGRDHLLSHPQQAHDHHQAANRGRRNDHPGEFAWGFVVRFVPPLDRQLQDARKHQSEVFVSFESSVWNGLKRCGWGTCCRCASGFAFQTELPQQVNSSLEQASTQTKLWRNTNNVCSTTTRFPWWRGWWHRPWEPVVPLCWNRLRRPHIAHSRCAEYVFSVRC